MRCQLQGSLLLFFVWLPTCCSGFTAGRVSSALQVNPPHHPKTVIGNSATPNSSSIGAAKQSDATKDGSFETDRNDSPLSSASSSSSSLSNYHLIWSPQVLKRMIYTSLFLFTVPRILNKFQVLSRILPLPPQANNHKALFYNVILPTLSSACCWIQMILNMVTAFGCAGFNTYIGPLRPFFLGLLTHLSFAFRHHTSTSTMFFRWTIALLPELLHFWNTRRIFDFAATTSRQPNRNMSGLAIATPTAKNRVTFYLDCPTMGCVACIQKINSSLHNALLSTPSIGTVQKVDSWLLDGEKGGKVKLEFYTHLDEIKDKESNEWDQVLVGALKKAGFPCTVADVTVEPSSPLPTAS